MKKLLILVLAVFSISCIFAQASYTSVSYNKSNQPGLMLDLPYQESVVEDFIVSNLKKTGYDAETKGKLFWKQNKLDGFYIFKEVRLEGVSNPVDLYFKVDQKSRRSKDESIIYLLVARGETFVSSTSDEVTYNAAKKFMNGFIDQSASYKLELDIKNQEGEVKDAEKKLKNMKDDENDLEKKITQLEKELKKNREDQDDQQTKLEKERQKLLDLRSRKG
jgi:hypothetical protein